MSAHPVSRRLLTRPARAAWLACLCAALPAWAAASEIAVNISGGFNLQASFAAGIDTDLVVDPAKAAARLLTDRLGTFSGGSMAFTLNSRHGVSVTDPGVDVLPAVARRLLQVDATATATGGLLATGLAQNLGEVWVCKPTVLQCNADMAFSTLRSDTPAMLAPATVGALLAPIRLQANAVATPLADGVVLNTGTLLASGTLRVQATFSAKAPVAYVADALQATAGTGSGSAAARWGAAAADVQALRSATWTDLGVDLALQARRTPELEAAQRYLTVARDSATLLATGPATGVGFASPFTLTRQLWDVAATLDPGLARAPSESSNDNLSRVDRAAEIGILGLVLNGADDSSFAAGLTDVLAHPVERSALPALTLDGTRLGLATGTTLSVYLVGDPFSGQAEIQLANAGHHALWRTGFDRLTLLDGPAGGLRIGGNSSEAGSLLTVDGGELYVGETFGGLLTLEGGAGRLALNNAYGDQLLVVASWGAAPVPEPASALLLAGGLAIGMLARRRRS